MTKKLRTLLVAIGLCVWSSSLWASLMASTSISGIRVSVVDTNPDDGIEASINWMNLASWANACIDIQGDGNCSASVLGDNDFNLSSFDGPVGASHSYAGMSGLSYVDERGQFARIAGTPASGQRSVNAARIGIFQMVGDGRVEFEMDYTLTAAAEGEDWLSESLAYAGIMIFPWDGTPMIERNAFLVRPFDGSETVNGTITSSLTHGDGSFGQVLFHAHTHLKSYAEVADVPEPGSLALSAAALCALGGLARRRARK